MVRRLTTKPLLSEPKQDSVSFAVDFSHDLRCGLYLVNKGSTLTRPKRQGIDITLGVGGGRVGSIPHDWPARFRGSHDLTLAGPLARSRTSGGFPGSDSPVAQYAVRCFRPADVEQFFEINAIVFRCPQDSLAIVRMNHCLVACKKSGSDPGPRSAECQGRSKATTIGDTSRCYNWN